MVSTSGRKVGGFSHAVRRWTRRGRRRERRPERLRRPREGLGGIWCPHMMMNRRVFQIGVVEGPTPCSWAWTPATRVDPRTESFPPLVLTLPSKSISRCLAAVNGPHRGPRRGCSLEWAFESLWRVSEDGGAGYGRIVSDRSAHGPSVSGPWKSSRAKKQSCISTASTSPRYHSLLRACTTVLESFAPPKPFSRRHCSLPLLFNPHPPP